MFLGSLLVCQEFCEVFWTSMKSFFGSLLFCLYFSTFRCYFFHILVYFVTRGHEEKNQMWTSFTTNRCIRCKGQESFENYKDNYLLCFGVFSAASSRIFVVLLHIFKRGSYIVKITVKYYPVFILIVFLT